jgi:hypothetical protein
VGSSPPSSQCSYANSSFQFTKGQQISEPQTIPVLLITPTPSATIILANSEQPTAICISVLICNPHQPQTENPDHTGQGFPKAIG